jgi:hypothetical protein
LLIAAEPTLLGLDGAEPRHHIISRHYTNRRNAKAACIEGISGTAEEAAEKLIRTAKSSPQALKREHVFNGLRHE